jgi:hypothetical protein
MAQLESTREANIEVVRLEHYPHVPHSGPWVSPAKCAGEDLRQALSRMREAAVQVGQKGFYLGNKTFNGFPSEAIDRAYTSPSARDQQGLQHIFIGLPAGLGSAYADIEALIPQVIEQAYELGKRDGNNILVRLAAGELTSGEFEREAGIVPRTSAARRARDEEE